MMAERLACHVGAQACARYRTRQPWERRARIGMPAMHAIGMLGAK